MASVAKTITTSPLRSKAQHADRRGTVKEATSKLAKVAHTHAEDLPVLSPGDHLDQKTFHRRYKAMPEDFRAELIEGVVIVPSPVAIWHGEHHGLLTGWLFGYRTATPGIKLFVDTTVILGPDSEPQPDAMLVIDPAFGGQTWAQGKYIAGPPELMAEVASTSEAYDLHSKYRDYEKAGVREYMVVVLREQKVAWFVRHGNRFKPLVPGDDGVLRSQELPGLWLDPGALLACDAKRVLKTLQLGLATPEHAAFVAGLKRMKRRPRKR